MKRIRSKRKNVLKKRNICDHSRNFTCSSYEEIVIINGKKYHLSKHLCKCYDCGLEYEK